MCKSYFRYFLRVIYSIISNNNFEYTVYRMMFCQRQRAVQTLTLVVAGQFLTSLILCIDALRHPLSAQDGASISSSRSWLEFSINALAQR